jgi:co-chaperonin GroES (HSP10)
MLESTPFHNEDGIIEFPYQPTFDRVFIFPSPPPEAFGQGIIMIPEDQREFYREGVGIVLAVGEGYFNEKGKWCPVPSLLVPGVKVHFDVTVPWEHYIRGLDGDLHRIVLCGTADLSTVIEEE